MIATSTVVMFVLMYSTAHRWTHVWWSETRFWMALYMGAAMAVIMLGFMLKMYENKKANAAIIGGAALVLVGGLYLARSQATVDDVAWMKAMIPHHSIAILSSERASITDPRVRRLSDHIILAQRREIAEMEALVKDLEAADFEYEEELPSTVPAVEGGSEDVVFVGVSLDDASASHVRSFAEDFGVNYPIVIDDGSASEAYGPMASLPTTFLIGRDGTVQGYAPGMVTREMIEPPIANLVAGRPVNAGADPSGR